MNKTRIINILLISLLFSGLFMLKKQTLAAVRCETQYGGGQVCVKTGNLQIDKEVKNPSSGKFVDNLGSGDHQFRPGDEITFRLKIKNVGDAVFDKVQVKDTLPTFLERVSGDLTFELSDLTVGETEERTIVAKVVSSDKLPNEPVVICDDRTTNVSEASSGNEGDRDTAQVCVTKAAVAEVLPVSGPSTLPLIALSSLMVLGFVLRKKFAL